MKLSASNIAWSDVDDQKVFDHLVELGFAGIEIAPTRLVPSNPYDIENRTSAIKFSKKLQHNWGLKISSMQSLLYGINERIFASDSERCVVEKYIFRAMEFAADIDCPHLVFGCPKNRVINDQSQWDIGVKFFSSIANHAKVNGVVVGIEANPEIYGTNYLNTTQDAVRLVDAVGSASLRLNYDVGTVLINNEKISDCLDFLHLTSHVHISEPMLNPVETRNEHIELASLLSIACYTNWVSLEMKNSGIDSLNRSLDSIKEVFAK